ncbi:MAG: methyltransferase domain-containing protein [Pseudonocardiales bacterium]|nr:methyltransferase domain-containing protein [Pseudonocardiales bacterium]
MCWTPPPSRRPRQDPTHPRSHRRRADRRRPVTDWKPLATAMAETLVAIGELTDTAWRRAFTHTPRHIFVPDHSLVNAYSQTALVTQWRTADETGDQRPTSSASAPGAVAIMLERLTLQDHHRVLEIGTGTGYSAALLCHRLGAANVYSIDIDPALVSQAQLTLKNLSYQPTLVAADGYTGLPDGAPYDRILATCAITHIPPEWIRQLADGGRIVAPIAGSSTNPLVVLDKTAPDEVTGYFGNNNGNNNMGFMPLRHDLQSPFGPDETAGPTASGMAHHGTTTTDPRRVHEANPGLALFCRLHVPGLRLGYDTDSPHSTDRTRAIRIIAHTADAVANVSFQPEDGRWPVIQRGPCRIWDTIETAMALWGHLRRPDISRLGVSALDDLNRQYVWLDDPDGPYSWPMPL